jgi:hypothetical protein
MNMKQGKITVMSMVVFCILVVAAMMVFKYAAGSIDKKQIKKEVFDEMGIFRGQNLNEEKFRSIVIGALAKRSIEPIDMYFQLDDKGIIQYSFKYEITINYILFKRSEIIEVMEQMENYGG